MDGVPRGAARCFACARAALRALDAAWLSAHRAFLRAAGAVDPCGRDMFGLAALHKFASGDKVDLLEALAPHLKCARAPRGKLLSGRRPLIAIR